jgi:hypothetical protein
MDDKRAVGFRRDHGGLVGLSRVAVGKIDTCDIGALEHEDAVANLGGRRRVCAGRPHAPTTSPATGAGSCNIESQMMAMFGWTAPTMPAHYIAKANREKLAISGMDKIVAFDQSH